MTRRLADYHPVTKRVSTFSADIILSIYYSYLFTATIHRMYNNSICQGLGKNTLFIIANFIQKKNKKTFYLIALIYCRRRQKWLLIECVNIYYGKV